MASAPTWIASESYAQEYDVAIVEDAAQAFGAAWKGKKAGTLGKAAASASIPRRT